MKRWATLIKTEMTDLPLYNVDEGIWKLRDTDMLEWMCHTRPGTWLAAVDLAISIFLITVHSTQNCFLSVSKASKYLHITTSEANYLSSHMSPFSFPGSLLPFPSRRYHTFGSVHMLHWWHYVNCTSWEVIATSLDSLVRHLCVRRYGINLTEIQWLATSVKFLGVYWCEYCPNIPSKMMYNFFSCGPSCNQERGIMLSRPLWVSEAAYSSFGVSLWPIHWVTQKAISLQWGPDWEKALEQVKATIQVALPLGPYIPTKPMVLEVSLEDRYFIWSLCLSL